MKHLGAVALHMPTAPTQWAWLLHGPQGWREQAHVLGQGELEEERLPHLHFLEQGSVVTADVSA